MFSQYMGEIVNQEEQLSYSRTNYNTAVRDYNTAIKSFPNNLLAGSFGFGDKIVLGHRDRRRNGAQPVTGRDEPLHEDRRHRRVSW